MLAEQDSPYQDIVLGLERYGLEFEGNSDILVAIFYRVCRVRQYEVKHIR